MTAVTTYANLRSGRRATGLQRRSAGGDRGVLSYFVTLYDEPPSAAENSGFDMETPEMDTERGAPPPLNVERWAQMRRYWWRLRKLYGGWSSIPPKRLPAFYAHPEAFQPADGWDGHARRSYATSLPEALAIQEVYRKCNSIDAEPVWYAIPRVLPDRGELLGTLHPERKACGKDGCRCQSGREEDLHGPYWYRHWRDYGGRQQKAYVRKARLDEVRTAIESRQRRMERMRRLREAYLAGARSSPGERSFSADDVGGDLSALEGYVESRLEGHVERWTKAHEDEILRACPGLAAIDGL